jgi:hypothetical protein
MTKNFTSEYHNISKSLIENSKFLKSIETSLKFCTDAVYRNSCLIHVIEYVVGECLQKDLFYHGRKCNCAYDYVISKYDSEIQALSPIVIQ